MRARAGEIAAPHQRVRPVSIPLGRAVNISYVPRKYLHTAGMRARGAESFKVDVLGSRTKALRELCILPGGGDYFHGNFLTEMVVERVGYRGGY